jgi:hypothetical protein
MKRPVGVILSCVVLGLLAALQLLTAAGMAFTGVLMKRGIPTPSGNVPAGGPPPGFVIVVVLATALFMLLLAAWSIATLVGLTSLRNWARYSVLVMGGCMAGFGTVTILGIVAAATVMPQAAPTPNVPAHTMQVILAFYGFLYAIVVAIGVWWLVYFNQRKTKAYFLPHYAADPALYPPGYQAAYPAAYPGSYPPAYAGAPPLPYTPPAQSSRAPTAIIVLACLFLLGTLSCLVMTVIPLPGFFSGFILLRPGSIFLYLAFALISGLIGIGFLRLDNRARLLCYAYLAIGLVNVLVLVTPWGQARYELYNQLVMASIHVTGTPPASPFSSLPLRIAMVVFFLALNGVVVWIIERYRYAFLKQPPPTPDPLKTPLTL